MAHIRKIVIVGSSGHARVAVDIAERDPALRIVGMIDSYRKAGESELGYEILGSEENLPRLVRETGIEAGFIAIGDNWQRHLMAERIWRLLPGFEFVTLVHPSANIGREVRIARGSVLMAGATVNVGTDIGEFCILNTGSSIDHDSSMGAFSSLGPGAVTGG